MCAKNVVLLTGGLGYIGSHISVQLQQHYPLYKIVIIDNLVNTKEDVRENIEQVTGKPVEFHRVDLTNYDVLLETMQNYHDKIHCVIHLAGLKAVGESVEIPVEYYYNNVSGTINLLRVMEKVNATRLVFSSSATVCGIPEVLPITEEAPVKPINPYGQTKAMIENILCDSANAPNSLLRVISLRYFNPIGAHPSGLIGENPNGTPNNLLPYVAQVCSGQRPFVRVYGTDYETPDGTGIRDYVHILDLADGHLAAMNYLDSHPDSKYQVYNLGTGSGSSVFEVLKEMEKACGKPIPYQVEPRRAGDAAKSWADCSKAERELGWKAKFTLTEMCRDLWNFQSRRLPQN